MDTGVRWRRAAWALWVLVLVLWVGCAGPQGRPEEALPQEEPVEEPSSEASSAPTSPEAFWNEVYDTEDFVYGVEPNVFFAEQLSMLPAGALLLPAEGEGRNAVWAASQGWQVEAFDISEVARDKALKLARAKNVSLDYKIADFAAPQLSPESFDAIGVVYAHMPPEVRSAGLEEIKAALKPGGTIILEGFAPAHLESGSTFGPKSPELLYQQEELRAVFGDFEILVLTEEKIILDEGFHQGPGVVTRLVARKRAAKAPVK